MIDAGNATSWLHSEPTRTATTKALFSIPPFGWFEAATQRDKAYPPMRSRSARGPTQRHFIDRLLDGKPFETNGPDYLRTLAVQDAVYTSAARGTPQEIPAP